MEREGKRERDRKKEKEKKRESYVLCDKDNRKKKGGRLIVGA